MTKRFIRNLRNAEDGVSPVVGSVLVLVIMMVAIGGIMAWGVPAIQGLQDRAEYQAVLTQFIQMQSDVRGLRDPQNTRISTIAISQGELRFDEGSRWVVTASVAAAYDNLQWSDWSYNPVAADTTIELEGVTLTGANAIVVDRVSGGTFTTVYQCTATCGTAVTLGAAELDSSTVRILVKDAGVVVAETWIMHMGHMWYELTDLNENNRLHFEMGAVFSQHVDYYYLEESPTIKDPDFSPTDVDDEDRTMFLRLLQLTGVDQGVSGKGRFPIVYHLVDNYGFSRGRPSFESIHQLRIQIDGFLEVPFCNYFVLRENGWENEVLVLSGASEGAVAACPDSGTTGNVNIVYELDAATRPAMSYDMTHSVVTTSVRTP